MEWSGNEREVLGNGERREVDVGGMWTAEGGMKEKKGLKKEEEQMNGKEEMT